MTFNTEIPKNVQDEVLAFRFKPYYTWMTFNTHMYKLEQTPDGEVLNLIIHGWPSIPPVISSLASEIFGVLNLIIHGWPSIPKDTVISLISLFVLNLIIHGWPSILINGSKNLSGCYFYGF